MFEIGEKVVYPHHGAGTIVKKEKRTILGEEREYLTIQILHNDMTVNVPTENAEKVGLREVIDEETVELVLKALTGNGTVMPKNWNRRFKHNREKMKTGDIFELAEVVRNLSLRDQDKGLSTGEKQMFVKAKKILVSELMYAKQMDEEETAEWLDGVLADADKPKKPRVKATALKAHRVKPARLVARAPRRFSACRVWAVIAAAGEGHRLGLNRPKAFAPLGNRVLLAESIERLEETEWIDGGIVVVVAGGVGGAGDPAGRGARRVQGHRGRRRRRHARRLRARGRGGGAGGCRRHRRARRRPAARLRGRRRPRAHGAERRLGRGRARPRAVRHGQARRPRRVEETLPRDRLRLVQTPQAFLAGALRDALDAADDASDCAAMVEARGGRVAWSRATGGC